MSSSGRKRGRPADETSVPTRERWCAVHRDRRACDPEVVRNGHHMVDRSRNAASPLDAAVNRHVFLYRLHEGDPVKSGQFATESTGDGESSFPSGSTSHPCSQIRGVLVPRSTAFAMSHQAPAIPPQIIGQGHDVRVVHFGASFLPRRLRRARPPSGHSA